MALEEQIYRWFVENNIPQTSEFYILMTFYPTPAADVEDALSVLVDKGILSYYRDDKNDSWYGLIG